MTFNLECYNELNINYNRSVLIIIDMIKGFANIGNLKSEYVLNIAEDIRVYSEKFSHIIAINDNHDVNDCEFNTYPNHCISNTEEVEFCEELKNVKFSNVLYKNCTNGFFAKDFLKVFNYYIDNDFSFIVSGCCTDICILQFCITFKGYLNSINKNLDILVPVNLVETYDSVVHPRNSVNNISLYLMKNMGIKLIKS